jgi:hypothetical protein
MNAETFAPDGLVPADHVGGLTPGTDWNNMDGAKFIANLESYQRYRCCDKFKDGIANFRNRPIHRSDAALSDRNFYAPIWNWPR